MTQKLFSYPSGIYQIRNLVNEKIYIGQSVRLVDRRYNHFRLLEYGQDHNPHLQSAYNKYGKENFVFEILIYCSAESLDYYEQLFVNKLHPEYNIRQEVISNRGHKVSDETKKKISQSQIGKFVSKETREKIGNAHRGMKRSSEFREKVSKRMLGHKLNLGRVQDQKEKDKRVESIKRYWQTHTKIISDESRQKSSISHINSPYTRRGEDNNKAKLTKDKVIEIRRLYKETDMTYKQIGNLFGVSATSAMNVCLYKVWSHVK